MMKNGVCPQCNSQTVYTKPGGVYFSANDRGVYVKTSFATSGSAYASYVCATCGYFENYIVEQNKLQEVATNKEWKKIEPQLAFSTTDESALDPQLIPQLEYYSKLRQTGVQATASIVTLRRSKVRFYKSHDDSGWILDITFDVTAPTGEHFQSGTQSATRDITLYKYEIGKQAVIKYDPSNKTQCVLISFVES